MPKEPDLLPAGVRISDTLLLAQVQSSYPLSIVQDCLGAADRLTERKRELPNELMAYFPMMLCLYRTASQKEVLRCMSEGLHQIYGLTHFKVTGKSGISQARSRVSWEPLKAVFEKCARPIAMKNSKGCFYKDLLLTVIDGTNLDLDDCPENSAYFGRSSNQHGEGAYPKARVVGLMEAGTRVTFGLSIGKYCEPKVDDEESKTEGQKAKAKANSKRVSENALAMDLIHLLKEGMLCLADRLFMSFEIFEAAKNTGADLLFRAREDRKPTFVETLPDGSMIAFIYSIKDYAKKNPIKVRIVDFDVEVKIDKTTEFHHYKLITTLLDHQKFPIKELAAVYRERWEVETMLDEVKTHLMGSMTLRSRTPDLVKQEIYGMFMAHNVIRTAMHQAAISANIDPDDLSFTHSKNVIQSHMPKFGSFPP
jgi:hypothetical protein